MLFNIDRQKYRIVDLSYTVEPNDGGERPFVIERGLLPDRAFKHNVLNTHSHVGTHVEAPAHFFDGGKDVTDLPLSTFHGRAVLLELSGFGESRAVMPEHIEQDIGSILKPGDIVIARNNDAGPSGVPPLECPHMTPEAAAWLAAREIKMLGVDNNVVLSKDIPDARELHDILMGRGIVLVEWLDNLAGLRRKEFYFMALPYKVRVIDSSWARAVAIEEI